MANKKIKDNSQKKNSELSYNSIVERINDEIDRVVGDIDKKQTEKFINKILKSKRIFLTGGGRSGLVAEAFAMRLVQLGFESYIIGETTAPSITKKDLVIAISGSGKTKMTLTVVNSVRKSYGNNVKICTITADNNSPIAKKSDLTVVVNAKTKSNKMKSLEPMGSLFEQSTFIYLDSVVIVLMKRLGKTQGYMKKRHSKIT